MQHLEFLNCSYVAEHQGDFQFQIMNTYTGSYMTLIMSTAEEHTELS